MADLKYNTAEWWGTQIRFAHDARRRFGQDEKWRPIEDAWRHEGPDFELDQPSENMIYTIGRALESQTIINSPVILNSPKNRGVDPVNDVLTQAEIAVKDAVDALLFEETEAGDQFLKMPRDNFLKGIGAIKLGWDFETNGVDGELHEPIDGVADRARRSNFPWIDRIDPRNLMIDPAAVDERNCRYTIEEMWIPTRLLKRRKGINKKRVTVDGKFPEFNSANHSVERFSTLQGDEFTRVFEIHEQEKRTWSLVSSSHEFLMGPQDDPLQVDGLPITFFRFSPDDLSLWGTPIASRIMNLQYDLNECKRQELNQRRIAGLKMAVRRGAVKPEELIKWYNEGNPILQFEDMGLGDDIRKNLVELNPSIAFDLITYRQQLWQAAFRIVGLGNNQIGTTNSGRRTKREVDLVQANSSIRTQMWQTELGKGIERIGTRMQQLYTRYWDRDTLAQVVGVDAATYYVTVSPKDISRLQMNTRTRVDITSMLPRNKQQEREEMLQMAQILANVPNVDIFPIIRQILGRFDWADVGQILPQAAQSQVLSLQDFQTQQQGLIGGAEQLGPVAGNRLQLLAGGGGNQQQAA